VRAPPSAPDSSDLPSRLLHAAGFASFAVTPDEALRALYERMFSRELSGRGAPQARAVSRECCSYQLQGRDRRPFAHLRAIAGQVQLLAALERRGRDVQVDEPDRLALAAPAGARHAGDGDADLGAGRRTSALGHRGRALG